MQQLTLPMATHLVEIGLEYDLERPELGVYRVWSECDPEGNVLRSWMEPAWTMEEWEMAVGWPHPLMEKAP